MLVMIGAGIPLIAIETVSELPAYEMYFSLFSKDSEFEGFLYSIASCLILITLAYIFSPKNAKISTRKIEVLPNQLRTTLFVLGVAGLLIDVVLSIIFGMSQSNIVTQRPQWALFFGYASGMIKPAFFVLLLDDLMGKGTLTRRTVFLMLLQFVSLALSESRSGLIVFIYFIVCGLAYSPLADKRKLGFTWLSPDVLATSSGSKSQRLANAGKIRGPTRTRARLWILMLLAIFSVLAGQLIRHSGDLTSIIGLVAEGVVRFYVNNMALYLAIEDHAKIQAILLDNEPWTFFSQFYSIFGYPREMPSSMRLLEWWGAVAEESDSGHISGYAYGWLGLSYGLMKWFGLVIIATTIGAHLYLMRSSSYGRVTLRKRIIFFLVSSFFLEFFMNLGLDSYLEKIIKTSFYSLCFYMLIISLLAFRSVFLARVK